ncbi:MAG TPA: hypothetical protein VNS34_06805 [Rhizobiaceae bacterium]|nr:hypothetical protein [Rhizobiaceae bacterium]
MANPARKYDDPQDPRLVNDPVNPVPPLGTDPTQPRMAATDTPRADEPVMRTDRGMGTSVLIAAVVLVLAVIAYFMFGPRNTETVTPTEQPAATAPATPTTPAPESSAPTTPAPSGTAPATPTEPAPANPATPAQPAPAQ